MSNLSGGGTDQGSFTTFWLPLLGFIIQTGAVVLGVLGFYRTVDPTYKLEIAEQKKTELDRELETQNVRLRIVREDVEKLREEVVQKTAELASKEDEASKASIKADVAVKQVLHVERQLADLRRQLEITSSKEIQARQRSERAVEEVAIASAKLKEINETLKSQRLRTGAFNLLQCLHIPQTYLRGSPSQCVENHLRNVEMQLPEFSSAERLSYVELARSVLKNDVQAADRYYADYLSAYNQLGIARGESREAAQLARAKVDAIVATARSHYNRQTGDSAAMVLELVLQDVVKDRVP